MKSIIGTGIRLAVLAFPSLAVAESGQPTGWFVEAAVSEVRSSAQLSEFTVDSDDTGVTLGIGHAFSPYVQVRASYSDLGEHSATDCPPPRLCIVQNGDSVDFEAFALTAQGTLPLTDYLDVYARAGVMRWDADFRRFDRDDIDTDVVLGAGLGYRFADHWRLDVAYSRANLDLETYGVGLQYRF